MPKTSSSVLRELVPGWGHHGDQAQGRNGSFRCEQSATAPLRGRQAASVVLAAGIRKTATLAWDLHSCRDCVQVQGRLGRAPVPCALASPAPEPVADMEAQQECRARIERTPCPLTEVLAEGGANYQLVVKWHWNRGTRRSCTEK